MKMNMKKKLIGSLMIIALAIGVVGCTQSQRASSNLSKEADNFNVVRQLTVINSIQGDVLFQMTGKLSIYADTEDNQLEVTVEDENGNYQKHYVGLSDNVTYTLEQLRGKNVSNHRYTLNYNPKMWLPIDVKNID